MRREVWPNVCKDCKARFNCPEPCTAFEQLEAIKNKLDELVAPDFKGGEI